MKKKTLVWSAALALGLGAVSAAGAETSLAATSADFTDLKDLDTATKAKFDALIAAGIFEGVSDTSFGLQEEMNRAQFAKVAALILDLKADATTSSFSDVKADGANGYALPYIEALKQAGLTDGIGEGQFNPAGKVTKEQLATFLVRILGKDTEAEQTAGVNDGSVSDWAKGYVAKAIELKLLSNGADGKFGGTTNATRDLLVLGSYETKVTYEELIPLRVSGAEFGEGNTLELTISGGIDESSIDLSKITVNGKALDPTKDSFKLSDDKKSIVITLHDGFTIDTATDPVVKADGLKTLFGNEVKNDDSQPIPVKVTTAPKGSTSSATTTTTSTTPYTPPASVAVPVISSASEVASTSAHFGITASVAGTVYYAVYPSVASAPSLDLIMDAGSSHVAAAEQLSFTIDLTELTPNTSYVLYAFERNSSGVNSALASNAFTTLEAEEEQEEPQQPQEPTISIDTSSLSTDSHGFSLSVSASAEIETLYYFVVPGAYNSSYNAETVKGTADSSIPVTNSQVTVSDDALAAATSYTVYIVGESASGLTSVAYQSFTTAAAAAAAPYTATFDQAGTLRTESGSTSTITAQATSDGADTVHYVLVDSMEAGMSEALILEGKNAGGGAAIRSGTMTKAGNGFTVTLDNLDSNKTYYLYAVGSNTLGTGSLSTYIYYRTDSVLNEFDVTLDGIQATVGYTSSYYNIYYLVETYDSVEPTAPSADYVITYGMSSTNMNVLTINELMLSMQSAKIYFVVVDGAYRSNVVEADYASGGSGGLPGGGIILPPW
ncbi:S-layer homology domain-containing protein [Cohnella fermenti]|uniref:S-layer homology domain-containing protein n=1 Tax=Cohnella fermenti TaxID=2565925 RepID=UPI001454E2E2|nr:S-layer homology domain-containing protein [Cohnella fermenti]